MTAAAGFEPFRLVYRRHARSHRTQATVIWARDLKAAQLEAERYLARRGFAEADVLQVYPVPADADVPRRSIA